MARKNDILSIYTKEVEQIKADGLFKGGKGCNGRRKRAS